MDEPVLTMATTRLHAEPGGQAQLPVTVRNRGHLVDSFRVDVVGLDPSWWQVHPPELDVYPDTEESAVVVLAPPATAPASDGALPFGVRAVSTLDVDRAVVEEGDLEVGRIDDLQAALSPVTSQGRWSGRHTITCTNRGNAPVTLRLTAADDNEELGFRLDPERVPVPVGGSATVRLRVRPRAPFLRGAPVRRPFRVVGEPDAPRQATPADVPAADRPVLDGAIRQLPVLPRGAVALGVVLVAAVAGLVVAAVTAGPVVGARKSDVRLDTPIGLVAEAVAPDSIRLRWEPSDRAEHYRVERLVEGTADVLQTVEVPSGATALAVTVERPLTHACYRVVAVRGPLVSDPSAAGCATTLDGPVPPTTGPPSTAPTAPPAPAPGTGGGAGTPGALPQAQDTAQDGKAPPAPAPAGVGAPPAPTDLTARRRNMSGSTAVALTWNPPAEATGWSVTGYRVRTGSDTATVTGATEFLDLDGAHYCTPGLVYEVVTVARAAGTATSAESPPAMVTVTDPVDCTFPSRITAAQVNPDGSVTVRAVCETDLRGPGRDTDIAVLVDGDVWETQRCQDGADPAHLDDPHTFTVTGLAPATTYTLTTRTTGPSGVRTSDPYTVTTS